MLVSSQQISMIIPWVNKLALATFRMCFPTTWRYQNRLLERVANARKWIILRLRIPVGISKATLWRGQEGMRESYNYSRLKDDVIYWGEVSRGNCHLQLGNSRARARERERERACVEILAWVVSPTDNRCSLSNWMRFLSFLPFFFISHFE